MVVGMTPPRIDGRNNKGIEGKCHAGWKSVQSSANGFIRRGEQFQVMRFARARGEVRIGRAG